MKKYAVTVLLLLTISKIIQAEIPAHIVLPPHIGKLFENHQISISLPYPYPANENATFHYQLFQDNVDAKLVFYDVLGNEVATYRLTAGNTYVVIPTANFKTGMYLYSLVLDGKNVVTKKLLVNH